MRINMIISATAIKFINKHTILLPYADSSSNIQAIFRLMYVLLGGYVIANAAAIQIVNKSIGCYILHELWDTQEL